MRSHVILHAGHMSGHMWSYKVTCGHMRSYFIYGHMRYLQMYFIHTNTGLVKMYNIYTCTVCFPRNLTLAAITDVLFI